MEGWNALIIDQVWPNSGKQQVHRKYYFGERQQRLGVGDVYYYYIA